MEIKSTESSSTEAKEKLFEEAIERRDAAAEYWDENFKDHLADKEFLAGKHWPEKVVKLREDQGRPCLVVDKLQQYVNQVVNDGRQNRPGIKARPVDDYGDEEVAEVLNGIIRHISDRSNADQAYDCALENAAISGFGFYRLLTEYANSCTFDQEIKISRIRNPLTVLLDYNYKEADASDIKWAFIQDEMSTDEFEALYPKAEKVNWQDDAGDYKEGWFSENKVRVCEYFYMEDEMQMLVLMTDGTTIKKSEYEKAISEGLTPPAIVEEREIPCPSVKWCRMSGAEILEERDWKGRYIPIVAVFGNEVDIDGKVVYSGMIRPAKDAQLLYDYNRSAFAERVALTPKSPYIAAAGQVDDRQQEWEDANTGNSAVLIYDEKSLDGTLIPPPARQPAADIPAGFAQDIQISEHDIQGALGMYNASVGEQGNEKSGRAIMARQREGDVATFHYHDNANRARSLCGKMIVDLIPYVYDSKRVQRILGEDGEGSQITINPDQDEAVLEADDGTKIFNLNVGEYDVTMESGANYTTKRQEAAESMMQLVQSNPDLFGIIGDIMVRNMDWPGADEISKRLKAMLPPELQALEDEDSEESPEVQQVKMQAEQMMEQMSQQMEQMQAALQEAEAKANTEQEKIAVEQMKLQIEQFKAETDRLKVEVDQANAQSQTQIDAMAAHAEIVTAEADKLQAASDMVGNIAEEMEKEEPEEDSQKLDSMIQQLMQGLGVLAENQAEALQILANQQEQGNELTAQMLMALKEPRQVSIERGQNGEMTGANVG